MFNQNQLHINYVDNSLVQKLQPESYDISLMSYEDTQASGGHLTGGPLDLLYDMDSRPCGNLDTVFENKMNKR